MRTIKKVGQPFYDEAVYRDLKPKAVDAGVRLAFGRPLEAIRMLEGYERIKLRWVKPDGTPR